MDIKTPDDLYQAMAGEFPGVHTPKSVYEHFRKMADFVANLQDNVVPWHKTDTYDSMVGYLKQGKHAMLELATANATLTSLKPQIELLQHTVAHQETDLAEQQKKLSNQAASIGQYQEAEKEKDQMISDMMHSVEQLAQQKGHMEFALGVAQKDLLHQGQKLVTVEHEAVLLKDALEIQTSELQHSKKSIYHAVCWGLMKKHLQATYPGYQDVYTPAVANYIEVEVALLKDLEQSRGLAVEQVLQFKEKLDVVKADYKKMAETLHEVSVSYEAAKEHQYNWKLVRNMMAKQFNAQPQCTAETVAFQLGKFQGELDYAKSLLKHVANMAPAHQPGSSWDVFLNQAKPFVEGKAVIPPVKISV